MPRTITEARFAPNFNINYRRFKDPSNGQLRWVMDIRGTILDQNGEVVREVEVNDVFSRLTPAQQTNMQNLADAILNKLTTQFDILDS